MACFKSILFFTLVVLYLASATAQEAEDAPSATNTNQEVEEEEEEQGEEGDDDSDDDDYDDDDEPKKAPTEKDQDWVKNLIGVRVLNLSDNCMEVVSKNCAKYAGNNEKTIHCAESHKNFQIC